MNRSSTERGAVALTALCAAIAVSGCDDVGKEAPRALAPSPTATPSPDADAATVTGGEAYSPPWLEIDTELVEKHLTHLEGREPPTGLTGAPGWDMEWCMDQLGWRVTAHDDGDGPAHGAGLDDRGQLRCDRADDAVVPRAARIGRDHTHSTRCGRRHAAGFTGRARCRTNWRGSGLSCNRVAPHAVVTHPYRKPFNRDDARHAIQHNGRIDPICAARPNVCRARCLCTGRCGRRAVNRRTDAGGAGEHHRRRAHVARHRTDHLGIAGAGS